MIKKIVFCVALIQISICHEKICQPKIAIIGGGIGGAAASHFLEELFKDVKIDLFEMNEIGGRLANIEVGKEGFEFEAGGAVIHNRNMYMKDFAKLLGLRPVGPAKGQNAGIWNGNKIVFTESDWTSLNVIRLFYRYGFDPFKLFKYINGVLDDFVKIYAELGRGNAYQDIKELVAAMNPEFPKFLQVTTKEHFENLGYSSSVIDELIQTTLVVNYGQETNVNSFVGCISMAGAGSELWSTFGGNKKIPEHLIHRNRKVSVLPCRVVKIAYVQEEGETKYNVYFRNRDGNNVMVESYDIVIIAAPLTRDYSSISFENFHDEAMANLYPPGRYHTTVATFLKGHLNAMHFSLEQGSSIDILSCAPNVTKVNSLSVVSPVGITLTTSSEPAPKTKVWKVFSKEKITPPHLNRLFHQVSDVKEKVWQAYPHYETPRVRIDKFKLDDNALYHINAIEWIASAMEMSAIGARNVANLAFKDFMKKCHLSESADAMAEAAIYNHIEM